MNNTKRDRDGSIEHLLREALAAPPLPDPRTTCLSAEIAAAFADDALGPAERSAAVAHAAGCARCQSLLAAVARTSPPGVPGSWWRLPTVGWFVPVSAAVAAGVIVWAVLPERPRSPQRASPAPSANVAVAAPAGPAPVSPAVSPRREAQPERRVNRPNANASAPPAVALAPPPAASDRQGAAQEIPSRTLGNNAAASTSERFVDASRAPSPAASAGGPSAVRDASASLVRMQTAGRQSPAAAFAEKSIAGKEIVSPDASSRWRILPGGAVQRSLNGGATWQVQRTGVTVALTAGASPSPSVCWLVGPSGTVLLSADGRAWHRVAFPELVDLVSVRATDESSTTVTASDGRVFSTKDGGLSWVRPGA